MQPTVAVQVLKALVGRAAALGSPPGPLLRRLDLAPEIFDDVDGRVDRARGRSAV